MKTILILTDFSENASHAAKYGYQLAKQIKGNIILCNAFVVPVEMPEASMVAWSMYEYDEIEESCANDVKALKEELEKANPEEGFHPVVKCVNEAGALQDVIRDILNKYDIGLIVMGTHGAGGISAFILGNHSRLMIDNTKKPLLLIPPTAKETTVKKIAFATDLENIAKDLDAIFELITYAKPLNADILLTYVDDKKYHTAAFKKHMDEILTNLSNKANYPLIYYRLVKSRNTEAGLDWLCEHGQVDMLAMVHRPHSFLDIVINRSHTQKMAGHITKPLFVFPAKA
jgi:nucleotide-binding universal stress UspA family protein